MAGDVMACVFEELTGAVHHNWVRRSTVGSLLRLPGLTPEIRNKGGLAFGKLQGIRTISGPGG